MECQPYCRFGHADPDEYCGPYGTVLRKKESFVSKSSAPVSYCLGCHCHVPIVDGNAMCADCAIAEKFNKEVDESQCLVSAPAPPIFASGAMRSELKPAYDQVVPEFIEGVAKRLALGQKKYSRDNWQCGKGDKEWIRQVYAHLVQHLLDEWAGKPDDTEGTADKWQEGFANLDAVAWNVMVLYWYKLHDRETYNAARKSDLT